MDQQNPQQNTPYESISSSMPTYESFSSQQNITIEDETIDVETIGNEDKKRKRKAPSNPRKPKAECWKYFDQKFEKDEDGVTTKMAYCKWCPTVFKADSHRHGTRHLNNHYVNCDANPDVEKIKKQKKLAFKKKIGENDEGGTSSGTLETWKYDEKVIKKSLIKLIVLAELPFKFVEHPTFIKFSSDMQPRFNMPSRFTIARDIAKFYLEERKSLFNFLRGVINFVLDILCIQNGSSIFGEFKGTTELVSNVSSPVAHLWFGEVLDIDKHLREWQANAHFKDMIYPTIKSEIIGYGFKHFIENGCMPMEQEEEDSQETPFNFFTPDELCAKFVEKAIGLLFAIYKEKYGTSTSSDLPRSMSNKSTSSRSRRGNAFINSFKDKVGNKLSGCEDELKKYLKEPRLELEDDEDFDILTWWKINSPRFPIVSRMAKVGFGMPARLGFVHQVEKHHMDTVEDVMKDDELV
ncbi:zinc finger BED domain-containing protein RICESLEEPER 2 [Tanacetum coccineum]